MRTFILPYRQGSASVRLLREAMDVKYIKLHGSKYSAKKNDFIINWGNNEAPDHIPNGVVMANVCASVALATNKLKAFNCLMRNGVRIPPFTANRQEAGEWAEEGATVVIRNKLRGHGGSGIELSTDPSYIEDSNAPLFTQYVPKKNEYRVHVVNGVVIDVVRKALDKERIEREGIEIDWKIRNHSRGFIFSRDVQEDGSEIKDRVSEDVLIQSINAVSALGLDFGAVDVIYNERQNRAYVLEVNTAPGIEGTTLNRYVAAFGNAIPVWRSRLNPLTDASRSLDGEALDNIDDEEPAIVTTKNNNAGSTASRPIHSPQPVPDPFEGIDVAAFGSMLSRQFGG